MSGDGRIKHGDNNSMISKRISEDGEFSLTKILSALRWLRQQKYRDHVKDSEIWESRKLMKNKYRLSHSVSSSITWSHMLLPSLSSSVISWSIRRLSSGLHMLSSIVGMSTIALMSCIGLLYWVWSLSVSLVGVALMSISLAGMALMSNSLIAIALMSLSLMHLSLMHLPLMTIALLSISLALACLMSAWVAYKH